MSPVTDEEKKMVSTILADCAKRENMTVEEFMAEVLPAFRASYENAKEDHKEFWEGFTPAGVKPTMDEIVIWVAKKLTKKQEDLEADGEEEAGLKAKDQVKESFLDTIK